MNIFVLCLVSAMMLFTSCSERDPKQVVIDVLQYAKDGEKEKILNMIDREHWGGDYMPDGSCLGVEETVDKLLLATKDRDILGKENVKIYNEFDEYITLTYEDNSFVNGRNFDILVYLYKRKNGYIIHGMTVSRGNPIHLPQRN